MYVCMYVCIYINPKGRQRQLKSSFIKTLFESKNVQAAVGSETLCFLRFYFQIKF